MVFVALALLLAAAWFAAGKMHRFAYWMAPKTDAEVQALAVDGWRVDRLQVADDVTLVGLVRPPQRADARWILFVPGNSSAVLEGFRGVLDDLRGSDDVGMAFWAYRGFDASTGTPTPAALAHDLLRQWQHLQSLGAVPARTEIWGYSLGSLLAVQLAARLGTTGEGPGRLVLAAAGEQIGIMAHGLFGRFLADDVYDARAAAAQVACPTVIVHGTADDAMAIEQARGLAEALGARATLHEVAGKGHFDLWADVRRLAW